LLPGIPPGVSSLDYLYSPRFIIYLIDRYPYDIPAGTVVPNWAYLNVVSAWLLILIFVT
jgi:hypothetical protein